MFIHHSKRKKGHAFWYQWLGFYPNASKSLMKKCMNKNDFKFATKDWETNILGNLGSFKIFKYNFK